MKRLATTLCSLLLAAGVQAQDVCAGLEQLYVPLQVYDIVHLEETDMSEKHVRVELAVTDGYALDVFSEHVQTVAQHVKEFYKQYDIMLDMPVVDASQQQQGYRMLVTDRVGFNALVKETFMPDHVSSDILGIAFPPGRYACMHAQNFLEISFLSGPLRLAPEQLIPRWEHTMAHEIGHMFGLWHDDLTSLDSVKQCVGDKYNLMAVDSAVSLRESALTQEQVMQMHNRLSGGSMSRLYEGRMWLGMKDFVDPAISLGDALRACLLAQDRDAQ